MTPRRGGSSRTWQAIDSTSGVHPGVTTRTSPDADRDPQGQNGPRDPPLCRGRASSSERRPQPQKPGPFPSAPVLGRGCSPGGQKARADQTPSSLESPHLNLLEVGVRAPRAPGSRRGQVAERRCRPGGPGRRPHVGPGFAADQNALESTARLRGDGETPDGGHHSNVLRALQKAGWHEAGAGDRWSLGGILCGQVAPFCPGERPFAP